MIQPTGTRTQAWSESRPSASRKPSTRAPTAAAANAASVFRVASPKRAQIEE